VTSPDAALAARPEACSACGGPLDSLGHCAKCGAVFGEAYRCPLCQALSGVEPDAALYYRCRTCGGPRIPPSDSRPSEAELAALRSARSEQLRTAAFRAGSGFALVSGGLSFLVTSVVLLATSPALFAKLAALLASVIPFALALFAWRRSRAHARALDTALQHAWLLAASRIAAGEAQLGNAVNAATLSRVLRVDEARAEFLLAEVNVQDFVASPQELPARVRVTELADPEDLSNDAQRAHAPANANKPSL
jgi:hypothetical protein